MSNSETMLHDYFGDVEFWRARRSMRFSKYLQSIANAYRMDFFGSSDENDLVQRPQKWQEEKVRWKKSFIKV